MYIHTTHTHIYVYLYHTDIIGTIYKFLSFEGYQKLWQAAYTIVPVTL